MVNSKQRRETYRGLWVLMLVFLAGAAAQAQQSYVGRYDAYAGFADLESPALGLNQTGYHFQVGMNMRSWMAMGFDYTNADGTMILTPSELPAGPQQQEIYGYINACVPGGTGIPPSPGNPGCLPGSLPAGYQLRVSTDSFLQEFAMGPVFNYRHFSRVTLFTHPSLGAFRIRATPHGTDPFALGVVYALTSGTGTKLDWTGFYGGALGMDYNVTKHLALRAQWDMVYQHPFNDILANGFWTERYSFGPNFQFGRNILSPHAKK
ncbi:MAG: hypothetical protein ACP5EP_02955 [Acidobacteriaceae bacterium]